jgi:hypothetical protein
MRFLWIGAPNARKGWELVLQAWRVFAGDPHYELYLKTTVTETTARMEARSGFWEGSVAAIIRPSQSGRPTSMPGQAAWARPAEALDGAPGLQFAAGLTRRLLGSGSVSAEARLLVRGDPYDVVAAFRLGGSIGVQ